MAATSKLDDVEVDRTLFEGDGKSSIDIYATPEQLGAPDGVSTFDLPDNYIGRENVLQSVQNSAGDNSTATAVSEPLHSKLDSADKQNLKTNIDEPVKAFAPASVENLQSGLSTGEPPKSEKTVDLAGNTVESKNSDNTDESNAPKRTGRPRKAAAAVKNAGDKVEAKTPDGSGDPEPTSSVPAADQGSLPPTSAESTEK